MRLTDVHSGQDLGSAQWALMAKEGREGSWREGESVRFEGEASDILAFTGQHKR